MPVSFVSDGAVLNVADSIIIGPGDVALWSVSINGPRFTGGNLTTLSKVPTLPVVTCFYTLDSTSSFTSSGGNTQQTLVWDPVSGNPPTCSVQFIDDVSLVANGVAAVMVDNNLAGQSLPGAGVCIWQ